MSRMAGYPDATLAETLKFLFDSSATGVKTKSLADVRTYLNSIAQTFPAAITMGDTLDVTGAATLASTLDVAGIIGASSNIELGSAADVTYPTKPSRTIVLPMTSFTPEANSTYSYSNNGLSVVANGTSQDFVVNLNSILPDGAEVTQVRILWDTISASPVTFYVYSRTLNFGTPSIGSATAEETQASAGATGIQTTTITVSPTLTINRSSGLTYLVTWNPVNNGDLFHAIEVTFNDPGPRNY